MMYPRTSATSYLFVWLLTACMGVTLGLIVTDSREVAANTSDGSRPTGPDQERTVNEIAVSKERISNIPTIARSTAEPQTPLTLVNSHRGGLLYAYVIGTDASNNSVALAPGGQWFYPQSNSTGIPQPLGIDISWLLPPEGENATIIIPGTLRAGRIYVSEGRLPFGAVVTPAGIRLVEPSFLNPTDPSDDLAWSFIELTLEGSETTADITYVDFVSLPLSLEVRSEANDPVRVSGVNSSAVNRICEGLQGFTDTESQPWGMLCRYGSDGRLVRVLSPDKYISTDAQAFEGYYDDYTKRVFEVFSGNTTLYVESIGPSSAPISCHTNETQLYCAGASRAFAMPTSAQIFGCNGTFAVTDLDNDVVAWVAPRLCAAFQRSTLLLDGGDQQPGLPATMFYQSPPTNHYAELVHKFALDGVGYAFPFDDVHSRGARDESGLFHGFNVTSIILDVGEFS